MSKHLDVTAIFIDLDDTLYDFSAALRAALDKMLNYIIQKYSALSYTDLITTYSKLQKEAEDHAFVDGKKSFDYRGERISKLLAQFGIKDSPLVSALLRIYSTTFENEARLYPQATDVLTYLKSKYVLCAVTEGAADAQKKIIRLLKLENYFTRVIISGECGYRKIDGRLFNYAIKLTKLPPNRIVHIGDSIVRDIAGAQRAGLHTIWLNRDGVAYPQGCFKPDFIVHSFRELKKFSRLSPRSETDTTQSASPKHLLLK